MSGIKTVTQAALMWLFPLTWWILLPILLLVLIWLLLAFAVEIRNLWALKFIPLFYNDENRLRSGRRRMFAKHLLRQYRLLDLLQDWRDEHFAEMRIEAEAQGYYKIASILPFPKRARNRLRREKTLTGAITLGLERLILVEGEPGSGKSTALRHVAETMAEQAAKARSTKSIIPIYVDLKELDRPPGVPIDRNLIEFFLLKYLKRSNDLDVDRFLNLEFHAGIMDGSWVFFFDSFDELPEILNSVDRSAVVKSYGKAFDDFFSGMNRCRGIFASRPFRGLNIALASVRFRILPLSNSLQLELINKIGLNPKVKNELIEYMSSGPEEIRLLARNPFFLTLLCSHVRSGYPFPKNSYAVFETYVESRLAHDEERLRKRFDLNLAQVRTGAENIAYCLNSKAGLGLSPALENLRDEMLDLGTPVDNNFEKLLDALVYLKFARLEAGTDTPPSVSFTFVHRRFQEYFASSFVSRTSKRGYSEQPPNVASNEKEKMNLLCGDREELQSEFTNVIEHQQIASTSITKKDTQRNSVLIHGTVKGFVYGEHNTVILNFQGGEERVIPFLAPPQPPHNLIGRADLLDTIKQKLFRGGNIALSALHGLPGVGKTAIALALAHDREVFEHFCDGVLWVGLGREANVFSHLGTWAVTLGMSQAEVEKLTSTSDRTKTINGMITTRRMLLVIDDVWSIEAAYAFKLGGPHCAHLLTTRLPEVADAFAGDQTIAVHELGEDDGLALLERLAPGIVVLAPNEARELVHVVGGLPLPLTLIGNYLRIQMNTGQPRRLYSALDRLRRVEDRLRLGQPQAGLVHHPSLPEGVPLSQLEVIKITDEALEEEARQTLRALSVFPAKPNSFSEESALATAASSLKEVDQLIDFGLLESSGPGRYTLHQTISDYARAALTDTASYDRMVAFFIRYVENYRTDNELLERELSNILAAVEIILERGIYPPNASAFAHFIRILRRTRAI